jgi:hydrogenase nickel incorporation protein HypA/HybF
VHELSIAHSIVAMVSESAERMPSAQIHEVRLRVGALAGVTTGALLFCYDIATQDTQLAGSKLVVKDLAVIIFCPQCRQERELPGVQSFRCPVCDTPSGDIRQGRELEIESVVVDEYAST